MGCCSSLFLREVSEALPWSVFGRVDHQVLPCNCVSCYHSKGLKNIYLLCVFIAERQIKVCSSCCIRQKVLGAVEVFEVVLRTAK